MLRRLILLIVTAAVLVTSSTVWAQPDGWLVTLYDNLSGEVVQVTSSGAASSFTLFQPEGASLPLNVAPSHNGNLLAYIVSGDPAQFILYDIAANAPVVQESLPADLSADSLNFIASDAVFSPADDALVLGLASANGDWQIERRAAASGWASEPLVTQATPLPNLSPLDALSRTPVIQSVDAAGNITFALADPFSGFQATFEETYRLDAAGNVTALGLPTAVDGDYRDGERLTTRFDPALPNNAAAFTYPQANALYLTDASGGRDLLLATANVSMLWARFVSDGRYVLVGNFSPENRLTWLVLDRSGQVIADFPSVQMTGVVGTPRGFAYTVSAGDNDGTILYSVSVDESGVGDPVELWSNPTASARVIGTHTASGA